ncbi:hypothetical protein FRB94_014501 [Tulasnella sp. JGI-2019a]|nr:hypothetical protein FRB94_014501 [Tulasnella sp. JGI-2019a]KAG9011657.1 hypothetical protein FRB93_002718 [Tulasnella sp. JGI-2019a]KAG9038774.1 hypothetical protein FRB95_014323 [Tulasnella sp. JGI-2019a]
MNPNDSNNGHSAHFMQHSMQHPFHPPRFSSNPGEYSHQLIPGPQPPNTYQPMMIQGNNGVTTSSGPPLPLVSPALEYPPITPPHLTHSRRGSRESRDSSSSQSTPSTGASGPNTHDGLVHRHKRGHVSSSMSPPSPSTALRKSRKPKKKDQVDEADEDPVSDDGGDPVGSSKLRREDAKKSRQDAEQKRRDQLKGAYDQLRLVVPGSTDKTSKVMLVNHARQHIEKLSRDKHDLIVKNERIEDDLQGLRLLNERLLKKLLDHNIDFKEDLEATGMELPPPEEVQRVLQPQSMSNVPMGPFGGHSHAPPTAGQFTQHRNGHSRNSSNAISIHNFGSDSSLSGSVSSHSVPLAGYPPLPGSAPLTPMRPSMMMGPPSSQPGMHPQVQVTLPGGMHTLSSPTSTLSPGSAASTGRPQGFPTDGQMRYPGDEHATGMSISSSMMGMEQGDYMRQRQQPPHRPPHQANGHLGHPFGHQAMGPPGSSAPRNSGDGQISDHESGGLSHAGHDSQLQRTMSHSGPPTFMSPTGAQPFYPDGNHDQSHFPSDFGQPPTDMYLPASPGGGSQAHTPQASNQQQGPQPHLQVPQHLMGGGHGIVPQMVASPHHSDRSGPSHSPLIGSFPDVPQHQLSDAGINPSMIMGDVNGSEQPMMAPAGAEVGDGRTIPGSWYAPDASQ